MRDCRAKITEMAGDDDIERARRTPNPAAEALLRARTILLFGEIDADLAATVVAQLLALSAESGKPIRLVINSPGGHVESGDSIHDMIKFVDAPVYVVGTGWVASAGALAYVGAKREHRFALPNTRFLLHQPRGGIGGPASDVEIEARQVLAMHERLNRLFARETGQPYEKVCRDTMRNHWMNAAEAKEYGLVHEIVDRVDAIPV